MKEAAGVLGTGRRGLTCVGPTSACPGGRGTPGQSMTRAVPAGGRMILLLYMMTLVIPGCTAVLMDMCGGSSSSDSGGDSSSQPSTHGVVASQDYPEHTTTLLSPDQCSCNFTSPHQAALLSLRLFLESDFSDMCDPVLLMMPYQICPALRANRSLNVLLPANEQILLTLNNPNHVRHRFYITYSAERPLHVECGPTWFVDLPPVAHAAGYDVTPTLPPGAMARDARTHLPAIIASIIIVVVVVGLIIAAIIRWRCVVSERKKKGLGRHIDDTQGDNPAFQHTPKSSIFDGRAPSVSSLVGVGRDLQPCQAPITGVGLLAAHSEPRLPPRPKVSNGGPYFGNGGPSRGGDPNGGAPMVEDEDQPEGLNHVGNGPQTGYGHPGDNMGYTPNGGYPDDTGGYPNQSGYPQQIPYGGHPGQKGPPNDNGYPLKSGPGQRGHPSQSDDPKQRVPPRQRGQPGQKSHPKHRGHPPPQEGYPNYAYDPQIEPQQQQPQYSQPLGARPGAPSSTDSPGFPLSRNGPHGPSFNPDDPSQYPTTPPRTPPKGASKHPRGAGKPGRPFEEVSRPKDGGQTEMYACAYCDQTEARYGRIICHLVKEHPDNELSFSRLRPLSGGWQGGQSPLSTVECRGAGSKDPALPLSSASNQTPVLNPIHKKPFTQTSKLSPRSTRNPSNYRAIAAAQDFVERPIPDVILDQLRDLNLTPTMNADVQLSSPSPTPSFASTNLPSSLSPPPSLCSTQPMTPNSLKTPSPDPNNVPARGILSLISFFESGPKTAATNKDKEDPNKHEQSPIHPKDSGQQLPLSQVNGHKESMDGDHNDPVCQVNGVDYPVNGECAIPNRSSDTHRGNQTPRRNKEYDEPPCAAKQEEGSPKKSPKMRRNNFKEFVNGEREQTHEGLANGDQHIPIRPVNGEMLHSRPYYEENGFMSSVSEDHPISNHHSSVNKTPRLAQKKHKINNSCDYTVEECQSTNHRNPQPTLASPRAMPRLSMSLGQGGDLSLGQGRSQHQDPAAGPGVENGESESTPAACGRWMGRSVSYTSDIPLNVY